MKIYSLKGFLWISAFWMILPPLWGESGKHPQHSTSSKPSETSTESLTPQGYGMVQLQPQIRQAIGVAVQPANRRNISQVLRLAAEVRIPEDQQLSITLRVQGWVTRLNANYEGKTVRRGDTLLFLYSPTLVEVQEELRQALSRKDTVFSQQVQTRLRLLGVDPNVITFLVNTDTILYEIPFLSPINGVILNKHILEGDQVHPGQKLFEIADLSTIWVDAFLPEKDAERVALGDPAHVSVQGETLRGKVIFISPTAESQSRTLLVRAVFPNSHQKLRPGMSAVMYLEKVFSDVVAIPTSALVWTGDTWMVFVETSPNHFMPRPVHILTMTDTWAAIQKGLQEGEPVVVQGTFLLDAESRLSATGGGMGHHH